ncbi:MAG: hypothetical protein ACI8RD_008907, partial [Bacillariaceae sp.]|jgi:hypothetical protein
VNARVLAKDPKPFDSILKEYPKIQLLIWTGTGEPDISRSQISSISNHFQSIGCEDQIGFDCQVSRVIYFHYYCEQRVTILPPLPHRLLHVYSSSHIILTSFLLV